MRSQEGQLKRAIISVQGGVILVPWWNCCNPDRQGRNMRGDNHFLGDKIKYLVIIEGRGVLDKAGRGMRIINQVQGK